MLRGPGATEQQSQISSKPPKTFDEARPTLASPSEPVRVDELKKGNLQHPFYRSSGSERSSQRTSWSYLIEACQPAHRFYERRTGVKLTVLTTSRPRGNTAWYLKSVPTTPEVTLLSGGVNASTVTIGHLASQARVSRFDSW